MDFVRSQASLQASPHLLTVIVVTLDSGHFPRLAGWEQSFREQPRKASGTVQAGIQPATGTRMCPQKGLTSANPSSSQSGAGRSASRGVPKRPRTFDTVSRTSHLFSATSRDGLYRTHALPLPHRRRSIFR